MCKITYYVWNKIIQGSLSRSVWKKILSLENFYTHIVADVADYYGPWWFAHVFIMQAAFDEFRGPELAPGAEVINALGEKRTLLAFLFTTLIVSHDFISHENKPTVSHHQVESDADLDAFVRAKSDSAYHPSCTCKMGSDDMAVVDNAGKVRNVFRKKRD